MKNLARLEALTNRHARLEHAIEAEMARPMPDFMTVQRLKKQKLLTKDMMARTRGRMASSDRVA